MDNRVTSMHLFFLNTKNSAGVERHSGRGGGGLTHHSLSVGTRRRLGVCQDRREPVILCRGSRSYRRSVRSSSWTAVTGFAPPGPLPPRTSFNYSVSWSEVVDLFLTNVQLLTDSERRPRPRTSPEHSVEIISGYN